jgi:hypothetical protein
MLCGALRCQKITLSISAALPDSRVGNSALVHYINKCQQVSQKEKSTMKTAYYHPILGVDTAQASWALV